MGCRTSF